ncbi:MAG TPA: hypothetical protein VGM03_09315 [Phycisphaerae bacterium]
MILLVLMRLHAFGLPLEPDECNYAYIGQRLLAGDRLYVDVWDHQPPAVFALFATTIALAGSDIGVFRLMAIGFSLASLVLIYRIVRQASRRVGGGGFMAGAAAIAFAFLSSDPGTAGEGCNREIYMNVFGLAALAALFALDDTAAPSARRGYVVIALAGSLLGIGSAFKTVVAVQWLALAIWLVWRCWRLGARRALTSVLVFAAGPAALWALIFGYFGLTGRFAAFYDAVFAYNIDYAGAKTTLLGRFLAFFVEAYHRELFLSAAPLWLAAVVAFPVLIALTVPTGRRARDTRSAAGSAEAFAARHHAGLILAYVLGSFIAVCLPGHSWPHYYYLLIPPLVILVAMTLEQMGRSVLLGESARLARGMCVVAVLWTFWIFVRQAEFYLNVPTVKLTDVRYDSRDWWDLAQAANVARVTDPGDTVLVVGPDPGVYFYSGRRAATRYTMMTGLDEPFPGYEQRRRNVMADLQRFRPRLILVVNPPFPELDRFLRQNYAPAGMHYVDYHDRRPTEQIMQALMDKTRPVPEIDWNWHRAFLSR